MKSSLRQNGIVTGLCGGSQFWGAGRRNRSSHQHMSTDHEGFLGARIGKTCPSSELRIYMLEKTTCDGKKKSPMKSLAKMFRCTSCSFLTVNALRIWKTEGEIEEFAARVEEVTGKKNYH